MATYTSRTVTTTRREYVLTSPTNWAEVGKVVAALNQELGEEAARWDDVVTVEARDDEIVFSYEKDQAVTS
jgi:hypothetical protein